MRGSAVLSDCETYRYLLTREWGEGPSALWIMLNPSTADADVDDPTIRRCVAFSKREGCGRLEVVNLHALRATDPKALSAAERPTGPDNPKTIVEAFRRQPKVAVAAWGASGPKTVRRLPVLLWAQDYNVTLQCLGTTKTGAPRHPLYVKSDQPLVPFA